MISPKARAAPVVHCYGNTRQRWDLEEEPCKFEEAAHRYHANLHIIGGIKGCDLLRPENVQGKVHHLSYRANDNHYYESSDLEKVHWQ